METKKIRVLIVDDHVLFRSGIKSLLQRHPEFEIVDDVSDGLEGIKRAQSLQPDVVLMDIHMAGISGREAVKIIAETMPAVRVLMLTVSEDIGDLVDCLRNGAAGYLLKNSETDALIDALSRVVRGESVVSPQMTSRLVHHYRDQATPQATTPDELSRLTSRERDVLACLARGETNKEIARTLGVAESTIKIHVQNLFKKLNLCSRIQAALYAVEHGIGR